MGGAQFAHARYHIGGVSGHLINHGKTGVGSGSGIMIAEIIMRIPNVQDLVAAMKSRIKYAWLSRFLYIFYYLSMDSHGAVAGTVKFSAMHTIILYT